MTKRLSLTNEDGEVRELTHEDLKQFRPASEVLPPSLMIKLGKRGMQKAPPKERITILLTQDVVDRFRASGDGWRIRVDTALKDWLSTHSLV